jgi:2-polyprenyl-3-methyl-5-hydroxy-6-metoxy-1,4-benzoquinol methylase
MKCIVCSQPLSQIEVGKTPISGYRSATLEESLVQPKFNLTFQFCDLCNMIKYNLDEGADLVLDKLYSEHVSTYYYTKELSDYMNDFIEKLTVKYKIEKESTVLEIGANSGRMLTMFREKTGCKVLGIEPSKTFIEEWNKANIEVINDYFTNEISTKISDRRFDLIIIRHVYEHIPDPVKFFNDLSQICDDNTTVIIEVPYFKTVLQRKRIENVSYSHLNYFTIRSVSEIAKKFGMGIKDFELVETDGGAIVYQISKGIETDPLILDRVNLNDIEEFVSSIEEAKARTKEALQNFSKDEVVGYGAGAKGQHLIYVLELENLINKVIDDTPGVEGMYIPGTEVKIAHPDILKEGKIKAVINLAPTHSATIRAKVPQHIQFIEVI